MIENAEEYYMNKKETNTTMSTDHMKSLHESWAGKQNVDGTYRVTDSHNKKAWHPYTQKGFKFVGDEGFSQSIISKKN